jgi:hypothetical protein
VSRRLRGLVAAVVMLACMTPALAAAQTAQTAAPPAGDSAADRSRTWIVVGTTSTTLRGDCQEPCPAHGTGPYLNSWSVLAVAGVRVNRQVDAGIEVSWVPATSTAGDDIRSTFLLATGQFRPMASRGFFLRGGMGMAFIRNFAFDASGSVPPVTSKALGLTYGAGWAFRRDARLGVELFGAQHVAALGDFTTGGVTNENVVANFWSVGAAIVIR